MQLPHSANSRITIVVVIVIQFMIFNLILSIFALFVRSLAYEIHAKQEARERESTKSKAERMEIMHAKLFLFFCVCEGE